MQIKTLFALFFLVGACLAVQPSPILDSYAIGGNMVINDTVSSCIDHYYTIPVEYSAGRILEYLTVYWVEGGVEPVLLDSDETTVITPSSVVGGNTTWRIDCDFYEKTVLHLHVSGGGLDGKYNIDSAYMDFTISPVLANTVYSGYFNNTGVVGPDVGFDYKFFSIEFLTEWAALRIYTKANISDMVWKFSHTPFSYPGCEFDSQTILSGEDGFLHYESFQFGCTTDRVLYFAIKPTDEAIDYTFEIIPTEYESAVVNQHYLESLPWDDSQTKAWYQVDIPADSVRLIIDVDKIMNSDELTVQIDNENQCLSSLYSCTDDRVCRIVIEGCKFEDFDGSINLQFFWTNHPDPAQPVSFQWIVHSEVADARHHQYSLTPSSDFFLDGWDVQPQLYQHFSLTPSGSFDVSDTVNVFTYFDYYDGNSIVTMQRGSPSGDMCDDCLGGDYELSSYGCNAWDHTFSCSEDGCMFQIPACLLFEDDGTPIVWWLAVKSTNKHFHLNPLSFTVHVWVDHIIELTPGIPFKKDLVYSASDLRQYRHFKIDSGWFKQNRHFDTPYPEMFPMEERPIFDTLTLEFQSFQDTADIFFNFGSPAGLCPCYEMDPARHYTLENVDNLELDFGLFGPCFEEQLGEVDLYFSIYFRDVVHDEPFYIYLHQNNWEDPHPDLLGPAIVEGRNKVLGYDDMQEAQDYLFRLYPIDLSNWRDNVAVMFEAFVGNVSNLVIDFYILENSLECPLTPLVQTPANFFETDASWNGQDIQPSLFGLSACNFDPRKEYFLLVSFEIAGNNLFDGQESIRIDMTYIPPTVITLEEGTEYPGTIDFLIPQVFKFEVESVKDGDQFVLQFYIDDHFPTMNYAYTDSETYPLGVNPFTQTCEFDSFDSFNYDLNLVIPPCEFQPGTYYFAFWHESSSNYLPFHYTAKAMRYNMYHDLTIGEPFVDTIYDDMITAVQFHYDQELPGSSYLVFEVTNGEYQNDNDAEFSVKMINENPYSENYECPYQNCPHQESHDFFTGFDRYDHSICDCFNVEMETACNWNNGFCRVYIPHCEFVVGQNYLFFVQAYAGPNKKADYIARVSIMSDLEIETITDLSPIQDELYNDEIRNYHFDFAENATEVHVVTFSNIKGGQLDFFGGGGPNVVVGKSCGVQFSSGISDKLDITLHPHCFLDNYIGIEAHQTWNDYPVTYDIELRRLSTTPQAITPVTYDNLDIAHQTQGEIEYTNVAKQFFFDVSTSDVFNGARYQVFYEGNVQAYLNFEDLAGFMFCYDNIGSLILEPCDLKAGRYYVALLGAEEEEFNVTVAYALSLDSVNEIDLPDFATVDDYSESVVFIGSVETIKTFAFELPFFANYDVQYVLDITSASGTFNYNLGDGRWAADSCSTSIVNCCHENTKYVLTVENTDRLTQASSFPDIVNFEFAFSRVILSQIHDPLVEGSIYNAPSNHTNEWIHWYPLDTTMNFSLHDINYGAFRILPVDGGNPVLPSGTLYVIEYPDLHYIEDRLCLEGQYSYSILADQKNIWEFKEGCVIPNMVGIKFDTVPEYYRLQYTIEPLIQVVELTEGLNSFVAYPNLYQVYSFETYYDRFDGYSFSVEFRLGNDAAQMKLLIGDSPYICADDRPLCQCNSPIASITLNPGTNNTYDYSGCGKSMKKYFAIKDLGRLYEWEDTVGDFKIFVDVTVPEEDPVISTATGIKVVAPTNDTIRYRYTPPSFGPTSEIYFNLIDLNDGGSATLQWNYYAEDYACPRTWSSSCQADNETTTCLDSPAYELCSLHPGEDFYLLVTPLDINVGYTIEVTIVEHAIEDLEFGQTYEKESTEDEEVVFYGVGGDFNIDGGESLYIALDVHDECTGSLDVEVWYQNEETQRSEYCNSLGSFSGTHIEVSNQWCYDDTDLKFNEIFLKVTSYLNFDEDFTLKYNITSYRTPDTRVFTPVEFLDSIPFSRLDDGIQIFRTPLIDLQFNPLSDGYMFMISCPEVEECEVSSYDTPRIYYYHSADMDVPCDWTGWSHPLSSLIFISASNSKYMHFAWDPELNIDPECSILVSGQTTRTVPLFLDTPHRGAVFDNEDHYSFYLESWSSEFNYLRLRLTNTENVGLSIDDFSFQCNTGTCYYDLPLCSQSSPIDLSFDVQSDNLWGMGVEYEIEYTLINKEEDETPLILNRVVCDESPVTYKVPSPPSISGHVPLLRYYFSDGDIYYSTTPSCWDYDLASDAVYDCMYDEDLYIFVDLDGPFYYYAQWQYLPIETLTYDVPVYNKDIAGEYDYYSFVVDSADFGPNDYLLLSYSGNGNFEYNFEEYPSQDTNLHCSGSTSSHSETIWIRACDIQSGTYFFNLESDSEYTFSVSKELYTSIPLTADYEADYLLGLSETIIFEFPESLYDLDGTWAYSFTINQKSAGSIYVALVEDCSIIQEWTDDSDSYYRVSYDVGDYECLPKTTRYLLISAYEIETCYPDKLSFHIHFYLEDGPTTDKNYVMMSSSSTDQQFTDTDTFIKYEPVSTDPKTIFYPTLQTTDFQGTLDVSLLDYSDGCGVSNAQLEYFTYCQSHIHSNTDDVWFQVDNPDYYSSVQVPDLPINFTFTVNEISPVSINDVPIDGTFVADFTLPSALTQKLFYNIHQEDSFAESASLIINTERNTMVHVTLLPCYSEGSCGSTYSMECFGSCELNAPILNTHFISGCADTLVIIEADSRSSVEFQIEYRTNTRNCKDQSLDFCGAITTWDYHLPTSVDLTSTLLSNFYLPSLKCSIQNDLTSNGLQYCLEGETNTEVYMDCPIGYYVSEAGMIYGYPTGSCAKGTFSSHSHCDTRFNLPTGNQHEHFYISDNDYAVSDDCDQAGPHRYMISYQCLPLESLPCEAFGECCVDLSEDCVNSLNDIVCGMNSPECNDDGFMEPVCQGAFRNFETYCGIKTERVFSFMAGSAQFGNDNSQCVGCETWDECGVCNGDGTSCKETSASDSFSGATRILPALILMLFAALLSLFA